MNFKKRDYFLGLDIGTESVGYAVTNTNYNLMKHHGDPMWGVHLFDEALLNDERRNFRVSRRRLDRRQQRIKLLQSIFAEPISGVDEKFFIRIKESGLYPEDSETGVSLFTDKNFNDKEYNRRYPTIHHLIMELIENDNPHDVRLVYVACAWLVAHRGHFLSEISKDKIDEIIDITVVYDELMAYFGENVLWECDNKNEFGEILKKKIGATKKYKELSLFLFGTSKVPAADVNAAQYKTEGVLKLICGSKVSPKDIFYGDDYDDVESFSLDKPDDELSVILSELGDDGELIIRLKALFDWAVLSDVLNGEKYISQAKIGVYNQHKTDLKNLKYLIKKYVPGKYNEVFRDTDAKTNYEVYSKGNSGRQEDFCKYIKSLLKNVSPTEADCSIFDNVMERLEANILCPKQVNGDNRVIPYQVYYAELKAILDNASRYLPFLNKLEDGVSTYEKIMSVFEFRVPYFVGPLNSASDKAWIVRKADGIIYPWNFEDKVDLEASEQAFIDRMTNSCTYLPCQDVLPKMSLCYEKFCVLNEINAISVSGRRISPELKQRIYNDLFLARKKVTKKNIRDFLLSNNYYNAEELHTLSGIDDAVKSSLSSHMAFRRLMNSSILSEEDVERIIERRTYTESKARFSGWLRREYPGLSEVDFKYICGLKFKDFGRLSRRLLCEVYGTESDTKTGEVFSVLERMWNENLLLMEILSDSYTYGEQIESIAKDFYDANSKSLDERLSDMYISNSVKRSIIRTLDIVEDVVKVSGRAPKKIFIEMARGGKTEDKGKRTNSRYKQICELYEKCDTEDVRHLAEQLDAMGDSAESRLQSDKLFLYYIQLGKCMYTGETIDLSQLSSKLYDIDHIYPQSKVKDDSVLNNKVLVLSTANGEKGDVYPVKHEIRVKMTPWWRLLYDKELITKEKYTRLTRHEPFTEAEQWGFINRQLVETRQSTKAVATILRDLYPETEVVYVKAGLVSEFRQEFDMLKSRSVNDLHHAKDAYLNIIVGNVYNERFTRSWFLQHRDDYNLKVKTLFGHTVHGSDGTVVWEGGSDVDRIRHVVHNKNAVHLTRYAFRRKGGLFDQQPVKAAEGLVPRKEGLPTEKYGGYNKTTASFFILAKYTAGKKTEVMLVPVELMIADKFLSDDTFAEGYTKKAIGSIIGKDVMTVSFPIGMRIIKIGTMFEFDGCFRAYLTKKGNGGKIVGLSGFVPLILDYNWQKYVKRLEKFDEKKKNNPNMVYKQEYDVVNVEKNIELYDILTEKLSVNVYKKRPANPVETLAKGREKFEKLDIFDQAKCLLQIVQIFGRINGCNLSLIGGVPNAAAVTLSSSLSNWNKNYTDVRIVDMSASGLYQSKSDNLLDLL